MTTAMRLSPYWPPWFTLGLGLTYMGQNKPGKAIAAVEYFTNRSPESYLGHLVQTWAHIENGNQVSAESAAKSVLEIAPKFSVYRHFSPARFKDPAVDKRYRDAMLKAGLPE